MTTITLNDATFHLLSQQADLRGKGLSDYVAWLVNQDVLTTPTPDTRTIEERLEALRQWQLEVKARSHHYPPGFQVDTDRESIYREREDAQL